jgi:ribose transport system substrate-binding protein
VSAVLVAALALAACGGGDSSGGSSSEGSSGDGSGAGVQSQQGSAHAEAVAAGTGAAEKAGKGTLPKDVSVGVVNIFGGLESAIRLEKSLEEAAKTLGWSVKSCDSEGIPGKMQSCTSTFVNEGLDVIFTMAIEPSIIAAQLKEAESAGIPVFSYGGQVAESPQFTGNYFDSPFKEGNCAGKWLGEQLGSEGGTIAVSAYPASWANQRTAGFEKGLEESGTTATIGSTTTVDGANVVNSARKQAADTLTKEPETRAFWFPFDSAGQAAVSVISQMTKDREPPVITVSVHADPGTQELIANGQMTAVCDDPYDAGSWMAVNEAAELLGHGKVVDRGPGRSVDGFEIYDQEMITKENLPPKGQYVTPKNDFVTFFTTKWEKEWGAK